MTKLEQAITETIKMVKKAHPKYDVNVSFESDGLVYVFAIKNADPYLYKPFKNIKEFVKEYKHRKYT